MLSIPGKSRVVRRPDSFAGINNNTHPLYKVRSLLTIYPGQLLLPVNLTHRKTNLAVGAPSGTTLGPPLLAPFLCFADLGSALPSTPRADQVSSPRGSVCASSLTNAKAYTGKVKRLLKILPMQKQRQTQGYSNNNTLAGA